ncbi:MAG TPA: hypothetical protein VHW91_08355 [Candidatus Dormibacteraeota bacterium]|jgi:hypothetical protein|nr:hypothetical protein [Candidatus Dormibacteraeota bacterium]
MAVRPKVDPVSGASVRVAPLTAPGVVLLLAIAAIDLLVYFGFALTFAYPGILFVLNATAAAVIAAGLLRGYRVAWHAGALLAASTAVAFVLVRTTGLPGFRLSDWIVTVGLLPLGPLSLVAEALFFGLYVSWLTSTRITSRRVASFSR